MRKIEHRSMAASMDGECFGTQVRHSRSVPSRIEDGDVVGWIDLLQSDCACKFGLDGLVLQEMCSDLVFEGQLRGGDNEGLNTRGPHRPSSTPSHSEGQLVD